MIRRLFTAGTVVSLLLFASTFALLVRSYRGGDSWNLRARDLDKPPGSDHEHWPRWDSIISSRGRVQFVRTDTWPPDYEIAADIGPEPQPAISPQPAWIPAIQVQIWDLSWFRRLPGRQTRHWSVPGIDYERISAPDESQPIIASLILNWWLILAASAALPSVWMVRFARVRRGAMRRRNNLCYSCGYDLRASKDGCPECGTPIPTEAKA